MWGTIILLVLVLVVFVFLNRLKNKVHYKITAEHKITEDKIVDRWESLINAPAESADKVMEEMAQMIRAQNVPNVDITKREIKLDNNERKPFVVVSHKVLKGWRMYAGAHPYGTDRLNVSWYLVFDSPETVAAKEAERRGGRLPMDKLGSVVKDSYSRAENLSMSDKKELENCAGLVHGSVVEAVKRLMEERQLDTSSLDTQSQGFFRLK